MPTAGFWLLALSLWLASGLARAAEPVAIEGTSPQSLSGYIDVLDDPEGELGLEAVRQADAAGAFRRLHSRLVSLGYREGATWVRFTLVNRGATVLERWLDVNWVFQQSYKLFLIDGQGRIECMETGARIPISERPLVSRQLLFPFRLESGESKVAYLRIAGLAATVVNLQLWEPPSYLDSKRRSAAFKYLGAGSTAIVIVLSVLAWRARGRFGLLAIVPGQIFAVSLTFWLDGLAMDWVTADGAFWYTRTFSMLVDGMFVCHLLFGVTFLNLFQSRWSYWSVAVTVGATLFHAALQLFIASPQASLLLWGSNVTVSMAIALVGGFTRGTVGRAFLLAETVFWLSILAHITHLMGWSAGEMSFGDWYLVAYAVTGLIMSYALFIDVESVRELAGRIQSRLLELERGEQQRLADAVEARTAELREAITRAEAANRAKSAFLSTITHELRTPLHTILGFSRVLQKEVLGPGGEKLAIVERNGMQLLRLIDEILAFSRGENRPVVLECAPFALRLLIQYLEYTGHLLAERQGNRLVMELGDRLPDWVEGDEQKLTQVLLNLIGNACKFTEGGTVWLRIARDDDAVLPEGGEVRLRFTVADTGSGIRPEDREHIFHPFGRGDGKEQHAGAGLGLAIVRQVLAAMGSEIELETELGRGSSFAFSVALRDASPPAARTEGRAVSNRVLVVDGNQERREWLAGVCRDWGLHVDSADALAGVPSDIPRSPGRYALALVDHSVMLAAGRDALAELRQPIEGQPLPVVVVSSHSIDPLEDVDGRPGWDGVIKPFQIQELGAALRRLMPGWSPLWTPTSAPMKETWQFYALSEERVVEFEAMVSLGQVVALQRWADQLRKYDPELGDFAEEVKRLARKVDLRRLKELSGRIRTSGAATG
jgi:signal transduction histidine kinase